MTAQKVIQNWIAGNSARIINRWKNPTIHTDGKYLYSYDEIIGVTNKGQKIVIDKRGKFTTTTSRHVSLAMQFTGKVLEYKEA
jgi:hypothetical protein